MALPEVHAVALEAQAAVQAVAEVLARLSTALGPSNQLVGAWLQERDILYARQRHLEQQLETNRRIALEESEALIRKHGQVVRELEGQVQELRAAQEALRGAMDAEQLGLSAKWDGLERQRQELAQQQQELQQQRHQLEQRRHLLLRDGCCHGEADRLLGKQTQRRPRAPVDHCQFRTPGGQGGHHVRQEAELGSPGTASDASLPPSQPHLRVDRVPETYVAQWPDDPLDFELRPAEAPTDSADCVNGRPTVGAGAVGDLGQGPAGAVRTQAAHAAGPQQCGAVPVGDVSLDGAAAVGNTPWDGAAAVGNIPRDGAAAVGNTPRDGAAAVGNTPRDGAAALAASAEEALAGAQAVWASREQELMQEYAAQLHAVWAENRALQEDLQSALACRRTAQQLRASNQALQQQLGELKQELQAAQAAAAADPWAPPAAGRPAYVSVATSPPHLEPHANGADGSGCGSDRLPEATGPVAAVQQQLGLLPTGGAVDAADTRAGAQLAGAATPPAQQQSQGDGADPATAAMDLAAALRASAARESLLVSERDKYAAKYREAKQACREAKQLARHWQSAYWGLVATYEGPQAVRDARRHDASARDEAVLPGAPAWDASGPEGVAAAGCRGQGHAGTEAAAAEEEELEGAGAGVFLPDRGDERGGRSGAAAAEAEVATFARGGGSGGGMLGDDGAAPRADGSADGFAAKRVAMGPPPAVPVKVEQPGPVAEAAHLRAVVARPCGPTSGGLRPSADIRLSRRGCNTSMVPAPAPAAGGLDAPSRSAGAATRHPCDPVVHQEVRPGGGGTRTHQDTATDGACTEPSAAAGNSRWGTAAGFGEPVEAVAVHEYGGDEDAGSEGEDVDLTQEPTDGDADDGGGSGGRHGNGHAEGERRGDADWQVQEQHHRQQPSWQQAPWQHQEQRPGQHQEWHQGQQQEQPAACYQAGGARCDAKAARNKFSNSRLATSRRLAEQPGPPAGAACVTSGGGAVGAEAGGGGASGGGDVGGFRWSDSLGPDSDTGALTAPMMDDAGREDGEEAGRGGEGFGPVADASGRAWRSGHDVEGRGGGGGGWLNKRSRSCEPLDGGDSAGDVVVDSGAGVVGAGGGCGGAVNGRGVNAAASSKPATGGRHPDKPALPSGRRLVQQQLPFGKRQRPPPSAPEQPRRQRQGLSQSWHEEQGRIPPAGAAGDSARSGAGKASPSWQPAGDDGDGAGHEPSAAPPPAKRKALTAAGGGMPVDVCSRPPPAEAPAPAVPVGTVARQLAKAQPSATRQASEAAAAAAAAAAAVAGDGGNAAGMAAGGRAAAAAAAVAAPPVGGPAAAVSRDEPGYKYTAVVRGRAEREGLQAVECAGCKAFYDAVATWGDAVPAPCCNHQRNGAAGPTSGAATARGSAAAAAVAAAAAGAAPPYHRQQPAGQQGPSLASALRQAGGRHRFKFAPPATPEGFWDIGFGDTQD